MLVRLALKMSCRIFEVILLYQPSYHSCSHFVISFKRLAAIFRLSSGNADRSTSNSSEAFKISVVFSLQNYISSKFTFWPIHLVVFEDTESRKTYNFKYVRTERGISILMKKKNPFLEFSH